ncbi:DUF4291 family protein [Burkholderia ubonensis]|uniref:DUF4291 family protein n=1 Tax=Burkholderia ubonensis TaxID=101571 RepID=UPI00075905C0|nr:DUF4291 family protein [Burkholderia ubonensis]KVO23820.1 hypothetical protein WJ74_32940 [Burkholderia ubonensis]KVX46210.1 hypothetical protein WL05_19530 [Burkholderia ubonensis]KVX93984.1 hypothetical protein WL10_09970 [Burkholderia ubonensis]KWO47120.1 hypothetical protein WM28_18135 [Burkholderia ubonensis]
MKSHLKQIPEAIPLRQIRAMYDDRTIRVYQAYSDAIADSAITHGTFVSPPFKTERMTWIKPSFLWMILQIQQHRFVLTALLHMPRRIVQIRRVRHHFHE